jgi:hypothetical protein
MVAALILASGCGAIRPARMVQPAGLERSTHAVAIEGLGAGQRGEFRVAGHSGPFTRRATRLAVFDELASFDRGGSSFTISGAEFAAPASARCRFAQNTVQLGVANFAPKRFGYECAFEGIDARFVLQEAEATVRTPGGERRGRIGVDGTVLTLRSVHEVEGAAFGLPNAIGYVFEHEGRPIGSVELNGTVPQLRLPTEQTRPALRRGVLLAALAVALLWDPAAR